MKAMILKVGPRGPPIAEKTLQDWTAKKSIIFNFRYEIRIVSR